MTNQNEIQKRKSRPESNYRNSLLNQKLKMKPKKENEAMVFT